MIGISPSMDSSILCPESSFSECGSGRPPPGRGVTRIAHGARAIRSRNATFSVASRGHIYWFHGLNHRRKCPQNTFQTAELGKFCRCYDIFVEYSTKYRHSPPIFNNQNDLNLCKINHGKLRFQEQHERRHATEVRVLCCRVNRQKVATRSVAIHGYIHWLFSHNHGQE